MSSFPGSNQTHVHENSVDCPLNQCFGWTFRSCLNLGNSITLEKWRLDEKSQTLSLRSNISPACGNSNGCTCRVRREKKQVLCHFLFFSCPMTNHFQTWVCRPICTILNLPNYKTSMSSPFSFGLFPSSVPGWATMPKTISSPSLSFSKHSVKWFQYQNDTSIILP